MTARPVGLSAQDIEDRRNFIGGSDANTIMNGSPEDVADLIAVKRGERKPKNLDDVLAVQMGNETEELNCRWFAKRTGRPVTNRPINGKAERRYHFLHEFMANTLDGMTVTSHGHEAVFQAKHTSERSRMPDLVERYFPQLIHEAYVSSVSWTVLSVFFGNGQWDYAEVPFDQAYCDVLIEREKLFWHCRVTGERWPELPPPPRPDIAEVLKISKPKDMSANNMWCHLAAEWLKLKPSTEQFSATAEQLKQLVDREVKMTFGAGVIAKVAKNGSVTLQADPSWHPANDDEISY